MMLVSEAAYATETVPFAAGVAAGVEVPLLADEPQALSNRRKIRLKTKVGK